MSAIVCIGEILWDIQADGSRTPGGAPFNVAFHCQQLGHEGIIISRIGDDELGRELRDVLHQNGMSDELLQTDLAHPTGTVQVEVIDKEPHYTIVEDVAWDYIERTDSVVSTAEASDALVFGTLAQRAVISRETIQNLIQQPADRLRVLDLNLRLPFVDDIILSISQKHCDWLKLSHEEFWYIIRDINFCEQPSSTADMLPDFHIGSDLKRLLIKTDGSRSSTLGNWQRSYIIPTHPCDVVDTVGAGDAFTAAMLCLHLEGRTLDEAGRFASRYAARICEHRGATPIIERATILEEWK